MSDRSIFPSLIQELAEADIPIDGINARLSQSDSHQILFMEFSKDSSISEHTHEAQWGVVLEGRIDLVIDGAELRLAKGDRYFIPEGVVHSANIYAGYSDITFFGAPDRYKAK
jgi:quercetin dioxygenase-like cupin family protein